MALYTHYIKESSPWNDPRYIIFSQIKHAYQCKPVDMNYIKLLREKLKQEEEKYKKKHKVKKFKILKSMFNGTYKK